MKFCFEIQIENIYAVLKTFPVFSFGSPEYSQNAIVMHNVQLKLLFLE